MQENLAVAACTHTKKLLNQRSVIVNRYRHINKWLLNHQLSVYLFCFPSFILILLHSCSNLLSFLFRCGTRPYKWNTQWDLNSLTKVCLSSLLAVTPPEVTLLYSYMCVFVCLNFFLAEFPWQSYQWNSGCKFLFFLFSSLNWLSMCIEYFLKNIYCIAICSF